MKPLVDSEVVSLVAHGVNFVGNVDSSPSSSKAGTLVDLAEVGFEVFVNEKIKAEEFKAHRGGVKKVVESRIHRSFYVFVDGNLQRLVLGSISTGMHKVAELILAPHLR